MAGQTVTISVQEFSAAWMAGTPIIEIASRYTITREQIDRLRVVWNLPQRRQGSGLKTRDDRPVSSAEDAASGESCEKAPEIARRIEELVKSGLIRGRNASPSATATRVFSVRLFEDTDFRD